MEKEVIIFGIDGLAIDDNGFNWKDRLMLTNGKRKCPGIALAAVNCDKRPDESDTVDEARHFLNLFLSCYQLINSSNPVALPGWYPGEPDDDQSFADFVTEQVMPLDYESRFPNYPEEGTMRDIKAAIPTFDKVMSVVDSGKFSTLETALIMYYRSVNTMEVIEDFIDMVTALEALFLEDEWKKAKKLSRRTAMMLQDKMPDSKDIRDDVIIIYEKRSDLVHGSLVPRSFNKELILLKMKTERYAHYSLLSYIDLASKGMNKLDIIKMLDDKALIVFGK